MAANDLIREAKARRTARLPPEAAAEIRKIMNYNDKAPKSKQVAQAEARKMLRDDFDIDIAEKTFRSWIREEFGRTWSGQ